MKSAEKEYLGPCNFDKNNGFYVTSLLRGVCQRTYDDAKSHSEALLSFTRGV